MADVVLLQAVLHCPSCSCCCPFGPDGSASVQPGHKYRLGLLPTPIHRWNVPNLPPGTELWIKRDDLTGMQLSGNKACALSHTVAHQLHIRDKTLLQRPLLLHVMCERAACAHFIAGNRAAAQFAVQHSST